MSGWNIKRGLREVPIPDEATLRKWADEGRFNRSDLIFHPILQRWLYAQDVLEIRSTFEKVIPVAPQSTRDSTATSSPADDTRPAGRDFIIRQGGQEFRAPDLATLKTWVNEQRIRPDSYIFHPVLQSWRYARELAELEHAYKDHHINISVLASSYRQLVVWVLFQLLLSVGLLLSENLTLILGPVLFATIIVLSFLAYRTAGALGSSAAPVWAFAMLIPVVNIVTLLSLSSRATRVCRANGVTVGFLGPRIS